MRQPATRRTACALALGLSLAFAAAGCGGDDETAATAAGPNDADVAFATEMIPHHAEALVMVDLTLDRPLDREVASLAEEIRAAQAPEIETMADWLQSWDEEVPETMRDHANAGHDMEEMPGMMTDEDLASLAEASNAEFQRRWLEMMIEHHRGAIEMAEAERADGSYEPAIELAEAIIDAQAAEIERMDQLLGD